MRQYNLNFLAPYNPQDPLETLFKSCADCQEIAIIAKEPYTDKQLWMNVIDLLMCCRMYLLDVKDQDRRTDTKKTWLHLCSFIQKTYQHRLQTGATTAAQGGYTNRYAGIFTEDDVSANNRAETIAGTVNLRMANLSAQTISSSEASAI
jgi:hypothetical protein